MKRGTIVAIIVLLVVFVVFIATRKDNPNTVQVPYVVKHVDNLARVELTRPGNELVIFEKNPSGWFLTKPVNAPLAEGVAKKLDEVFATEIRTDDLRFSKNKFESYELSEELGTRVSLYSEGADTPTAEFTLGKEMDIKGRVRRSLIMNHRGNAYRAQRSLEVLRQPVDDLRSKIILRNDRDAISEIKITGEAGEVGLLKSDFGWKMIAPEPGMPLERAVVEGAVSLLANLQGTGFADEKNPAEIGLEPPRYSVVAKIGEKHVGVDVGQTGNDWYVRRQGDSVIYTVGPRTGTGLVPNVNALRDRVPAPLSLDVIQTIEFFGAQRIVVTKNGETWTMLRPSKKEVKPSVFAPLVLTLANLRVARYVETTMEEAGLSATKEKVLLRSRGVRTELLLGATLEGTNDRYGKWAHLPSIFIIPGNVAERLLPTTEDLIDL